MRGLNGSARKPAGERVFVCSVVSVVGRLELVCIQFRGVRNSIVLLEKGRVRAQTDKLASQFIGVK